MKPGFWSEVNDGKVIPGEKVPEKFRGLQYHPHYEPEVMVLFGMLLPELDDNFTVEKCTGEFPDCIAIRNGKRVVGIEFETKTTHFFDHKHNRDPPPR